MTWCDIPAAGGYWLRDARIPGTPAERLERVDLRVVGGRIAAIVPAGTAPDGPSLDGGMALPCFVDVHTHLDKGHIWPRSPNPDGTFMGAIGAVMADREAHWSVEDTRARFDFALRCAHAHGTAAIRTHLDTYLPHGRTTWRVFAELRDAWAGRIDLQAVSICPIDRFAGDEGAAIAGLVADHGGVLGFVTRFSGGGHDAIPPGFQDLLDHAFALAEARGLDLDLHVDESGETAAATLPVIARTALRRGFRGRIQVGHVCSLSLQPDAVIAETIQLVRDAGIAVVSLPMCNMYLQDRAPGRTPRWRGVTLLQELAAAGVPVSVASDNCRDPFYPYGDHDMVEVFQSAVRIAQLDHPLADWPNAVAATPASVMGLPDRGAIRVGLPADLVLFRARFWHELLARRQSDRIVLRAGRPIDTTLPDHRELDALMVLTSG
ncbi:cytosine deaminase [Elioraea sp. Yellowstone]|jgi:cytosine deaminase|uniref:cytosine deaminase n=1 Tax=Elioraea sp. Yellowstone TaxID=2592070 RepID=UPI00114E04D6|nr:cytosine deaminase [Elioraea sp. Yellowstone]TQF78602.1 cytosine deaminase [Elioraea sp. Yellowstone]